MTWGMCRIGRAERRTTRGVRGMMGGLMRLVVFSLAENENYVALVLAVFLMISPRAMSCEHN